MTWKRSVFLAASFMAIATASLSANAETAPAAHDANPGADAGIPEITVTAQRKEESIQRVPVAVTVLLPDTFEKRGSFDPVDLGRVATGLFANSFNGDRSNIIYTIRGQAITTGTLFPAVVPYFAEVPLPKLFVGTFFDLENVQVLRGPQGTLFGRVTDGGNILIAPARPTDSLSASLQAKTGNYDLRAVDGMLNVPVVAGKLAIRGAFEINRRDGFTTNLFDGVKLDGVHYESYRVSVLATPTENLTNYTFANYTHANETGGSAQIYTVNRPAVLAITTPVFGPAGAAALANRLAAALATQQQIGPRYTYNDSPAFDHRKQLILTNKTSWAPIDNLKANLVLGYIFTRQQTGNDYDGTAINYLNTSNLYLPTPQDYQRQLSGEFQLQGKSFDNKLDWTLGTYWDKQTTPGPAETYSVLLTFLARSSVQYLRTTSRAAYGQASYDLSSLLDGLKVTGGARYTHDTAFGRSATWSALASAVPDPIPHGQCLATRPVGVFASSVPCTTSYAAFNKTTWNGGVDWQANRRLFFYGKVSRGYRPGGFNTNQTAQAYAPETVTSHEIGFKTDWDVVGRPLRVNVAGFYDNFDNIQRLVTLTDANGPSAATVNTKAATVKGIEAEVTFKPVQRMELGLRYTYLDAHYDLDKYDPAYVAAACPANPKLMAPDPTKFCPLSPFARTPKDTFGVNASYTIPVGRSAISLAGDWYFTDAQYVVTTGYVTPEVRTPAYNVLNLNVTWSDIANRPLDVTLFGTNVTNKTYISTVSAVSQMGSSGFANYSFGAPRMYGVSLRYRFGS